MASSSSSFLSPRQVKHQVFLSFRGPDTRRGFTAHLLEALKDKGINVFFDEETLEKGEKLSSALLLATGESQIAVIILSENYASSKSCLAELSEFMFYRRLGALTVLPIFYHVDPSDVRHHGGSFKKSFDEHQSKIPGDPVELWKEAFAEVGKLIGWHIKGGNSDRSEPYYIKVIVEDVIKKLNCKSWNYMKDSENFVGINDQKEMILKLINEEKTRVIGIWGMGGIGKTTLAEVVYNEVDRKFANYYFLQNVREKLEKQGMESLRDELFSKLLNQEIHIDTPSIIPTFIQERLRNQRVFLVLDDVNDSDQIECLGVNHFGDGSKILVTSRDQQVLKNTGGVEKIHEVKIYEMQKLNDEDSLQLFSKFAFKQMNPLAEFRDLSEKFVDYAGGLPLAHKILGGTLFQKPREVWESALDKLKEYPDQSILKVLLIGFDGLDKLEKNIFLDIACFFRRENKDDVRQLLSSCYGGAHSAISKLVDNCLVDRLPYDELSMHDLLQEMGRDIVHHESIKDPGKRSRLWNPNDVYQVFKNNLGTESIEGIILDMSQIDELHVCPTIFQRMIHLRVLKIYFPWYDEKKHGNRLLLAKHESSQPPNCKSGTLLGSLRWIYYQWESLSSKFNLKNPVLHSLPDELRFLRWDYYPFKSLPSTFNPKNLVELMLPHGEMEQLWIGDHQDLVNLRRIDLSGCKKLRKIPKLLGAIRLEVLECKGCEGLEELPSLKHLTSLRKLELGDNYYLKKFPEIPCVLTITSLELQNTKIVEVPDSIEYAAQISVLDMSDSRVQNVSSKISKMESLRHLYFSHCPIEELPSSIGCLNKLHILDMIGTRIQNLPSSISKLDALFYLNLSGCPNITGFNFGPSSVSSFKRLQKMFMNDCKSLKLLSQLPPHLQGFSAHGCTSLEEVSFTDQYTSELRRDGGYDFLIFSNCFKLNQDSVDNIVANAFLRIGPIVKRMAAIYLRERFERNFTYMHVTEEYLRDKIFHELSPIEIHELIGSRVEFGEKGDSRGVFCHFPGNEIFGKFNNQSMKSSIIVKICPNRCNGIRFLVFTLCFVVDFKHFRNYSSYIKFICEGQLKAKGGSFCKNFKSEIRFEHPINVKPGAADRKHCYNETVDGEHVCVLFNADLIHYDKDYEEASFDFYFVDPSGCESGGILIDDMKVKKCGVHVSYVEFSDIEEADNYDDEFSDIEEADNEEFSYIDEADNHDNEFSDGEEADNEDDDNRFRFRFKDRHTCIDYRLEILLEEFGVYVEYSDAEKAHDERQIGQSINLLSLEDATKLRPRHKRKFSYDGKGKRESKRSK